MHCVQAQNNSVTLYFSIPLNASFPGVFQSGVTLEPAHGAELLGADVAGDLGGNSIDLNLDFGAKVGHFSSQECKLVVI